MELKELKLFADMTSVYSECCEVNPEDLDYFDTIEKIIVTQKYEELETIFNEDNFFKNGEDLFHGYFGKNLKELNELAEEYGLQEIQLEDVVLIEIKEEPQTPAKTSEELIEEYTSMIEYKKEEKKKLPKCSIELKTILETQIESYEVFVRQLKVIS